MGVLKFNVRQLVKLKGFPWRARKAWCELTGGHASDLEPAMLRNDEVIAVRLRCRRCGKATKGFYLSEMSNQPFSCGDNEDA